LPGSIYEIIDENEYLNIPLNIPQEMESKSIAIELTPPCDFSHKKINSKLIGGFISGLPEEKKDVRRFINK
jgi:hypothetical protein